MYHIESMRTALINVARVRPGTSEGITDLLLPQPASVLKRSITAVAQVFLRD